MSCSDVKLDLTGTNLFVIESMQERGICEVDRQKHKVYCLLYCTCSH